MEMRRRRSRSPKSLVVGLAALCAGGPATAAVHPLDRYDVVWTEPGEDASDSMPIGNGDIGLNLWVVGGGDLIFLIAKTDAWDAHCRLLKPGRVRVKLTPNPFAAGSPFRQTLRLRRGEIEIAAGRSGEAVTLRVWVDANHPVVRLEAEGEAAFAMEVELEIWRREEVELKGRERDAARGILGAPFPLKVSADRVVDDPERVVWYHRNATSCWPVTLKIQGLSGFLADHPDPLLHRTFGGAIAGEGLVKVGPTTLRSPRPGRRFGLSIHALTKTPATEAQWLSALEGIIARYAAIDPREARRAHEAWWAAFWDRSWIYLSGSASGGGISTNDLPLRIGAGGTGGNRFHGDIAQAVAFRRALEPREIAALAAGKDEALRRDPALVGRWTFDDLEAGAFANRAVLDLPARIVGKVEVVEGPGGRAVRLEGEGYLEVADHPALDLEASATLAAWIRPLDPFALDGRILDKSRPGTADGYDLDTYPRNSLRLIVEPGTLVHRNCLKAGTWTHVAATFDAAGRERLYVDGRQVAVRSIGCRLERVAQGYALQRFINACGGRGGSAIKFNGSIFTVDGPGYGPDYRRWGGCYWWQNTRFPYWPMPACGDFDLMEPLFRMYRRILPLRRYTTHVYYDHPGAFFPETMYFWGTPCNDDFGWKRDGHPPSLMINRYIRREWQGGLELAMMMLDYYDYTQDRMFARETLLPIASAVLAFYAHHYGRDERGMLRIEPAQALETWWTAVDPMPEVAGLRAVLARMLSLPEDLIAPEQRAAWRDLARRIPPVPTRGIDGRKALAAAASYADRHNVENPELYAIFPYRLYGLMRPDLEVARLAFEARRVKGSRGWQQDPVQAAMLGLVDEAARFVVGRFTTKDPGSRFPAMWGPNFDWLPDQCHGGNGMLGLQAMLLQPVGRKILLLPAWPKDWDVRFKLHAPYRTTVEGVYRKGDLVELKVTPPERARDIVRMDGRPPRREPAACATLRGALRVGERRAVLDAGLALRAHASGRGRR